MRKPNESVFTTEELFRAQSYKARDYPKDVPPGAENMVREMISSFADKWTVVHSRYAMG